MPDTCELVYGQLNNLTKDEVAKLFEVFHEVATTKDANDNAENVKKSYPTRHKREVSPPSVNKRKGSCVETDESKDWIPDTTSSANSLFSKEDDNFLKSLFKEQVSGEVNINRREIVDVLQSTAPNYLKKFKVDQLVSKIRTQKRAHDRRNGK